MPPNRDHFVAPREREVIISLIALHFIEENALLNADQLADAKKSLQALFLRTSGEETTLRKLIDVLKVTRSIQSTFTSISGTVGAVHKSVATVDERVAGLRQLLERQPPSPEANAAFIGPFLSFSIAFVQKVRGFEESLGEYLAARELETRAATIYRIARDSRERLKQRLTGQLAQPSSEVENRIKDELVTSFNYGEAEDGLEQAKRAARAAETEVLELLGQVRAMCQAAMNPAMRDPKAKISPEDDMYSRFAALMERDPAIEYVKEPVRELLKLYQHAHGMFQLDYDKLKRALAAIADNSDAYFHAKEEDHDVTVKRGKLHKIEGLIPFLERGAGLARAEDIDTYDKFSRALSAAVAEPRAAWSHVAEDLLRAKVQAEAEISTRL